MRCFPLRSSHFLLLSHLLPTCQDTLQTPIQRILRRTPADYLADRGDDDDDDEDDDDDVE
ncbi:hypothetical protein Tco_0609717, partial [Tanacetum coccineum]